MYSYFIQTDAELLEIKTTLVIPERIRSKMQSATYLSIVLSNLCDIIDSFVSLTLDQAVIQTNCKNVILKFEKLRQDLFNKIKGVLSAVPATNTSTPSQDSP